MAIVFEGWRERRALKRWQRSVLGQALQHHGHSYFFAADAIFSFYDEEEKQRNCAQLHSLAMEIVAANNPMLAVREQLANYVLTFAPLMAAGMPEEGKEERGYTSTPYVSGQLRPHISKVADHIDELGRLRFSEPDISDEELASYCTNRASLLLFFCNGLNLISIALEDRIEKNDEWFAAFVEAAMVAAEDAIRQDIGLPSLLPGPIDSLAYSSFFQYVVSGEPDPFFAWAKAFPDKYLCGRGSLPPQ
ncbi:hypothetical protein D2V17_05860 [Aurantiacibacter xanthus]|uniref:Uncharacterized protein n=1 Tax=Aurantiacibacter xanthus TaxID=1784712 RepID=A0A3A1P717_9SPHN|nr:hypothetical protein [Aurantiacibacter xanthus]RIV89594.1 hypothetical protein D2V17_05860 [Aurantiacibacter xanthus]